MDDIEKTVEAVEKDVQYFREAVKAAETLVKPWKTATLALVVALVLTIGGFIFFLLQFNFESSNEANGIYAQIDANGNIISQDVSPEQWEAFTKWWEINGNSQKD